MKKNKYIDIDNQFEQRNDEAEFCKESLEDKKWLKELSVSRDVLSGLLVTINTDGGKFSTKGDFAKREDVFRLRCYALMSADKDEKKEHLKYILIKKMLKMVH